MFRVCLHAKKHNGHIWALVRVDERDYELFVYDYEVVDEYQTFCLIDCDDGKIIERDSNLELPIIEINGIRISAEWDILEGDYGKLYINFSNMDDGHTVVVEEL